MITRRILAAVALLCALAVPAHAQKTKAQIVTEIGTLFPDNTAGAITPLKLRTVTQDTVNSIMPTAPVVAGNLACFNGTTGLLQDCGSAPATVPLTVGTTPITGGTANGLLYYNAGFLGNLVTSNNGMLVTSATGVPSISNTLGGDAFFGSGRPWCDVRANGATGDGHTDDSAAVLACVAAVQGFGSGGTVYFPASNGPYCIQTMINITGVPVVFVGENQNVSVSSCAADITVFKLNTLGAGIVDLTIYGKGVVGLPTADTIFGASNPTVWMGSSCTNCILDHIKVQGGSNAIKSEGGDSKIYRSEAGASYGGALVYIAAGMWLQRNAFDQAWPVSFPAYPLTANPWAATTAYTVGQVVSTAGYYIQCSTAGTSGGTAPALKNYGTSITDGSAVWQLVAPVSYYGIQADTGASEVNILQQDLSGPFFAGLAMTNTLAGLAPTYISIGTGSVIGQTFFAGVYANAGSELTVDGLHMAGGVTSGSYGVVVSNSFTGRVRVVNNTFLTGTGNGVGIQAGLSSIIANNHINTTNGNAVVIAPNVNDFVVAGNTIEPNNTNGIVVQAGTSNHYAIYGNINAGVGGSMYLDSGTGTDKVVIATVSGNSSKIATTTGSLTTGNCVKIDANGNFIDATTTCGGGGGGSPGGSNTQVQYNNAGSFGGITGATTNGTALTLVAPVLGTPASVTLTNGTGLPISTGVSGLAAGIATWLATSSSANLRAALTDESGTGAAYFQGGDIGTPSAGVLTNATGLPISTGVSGLGTGCATFLGTPSSANLRGCLTDEVGTGAAYFVGGALGTPASGTATNLTGLPISTGLTGAGTGVLTALGVNVGTAGAFVVNGGALGTPSSGTLTSATGLPISTGVSGLGTGVATALGNATNASGGVVTSGGLATNDLLIGGGAGNPIVGGTGCAVAAGGSIQCTTSSSSLPQYILTNTANNLGAPAILFKKSRLTGATDSQTNDFLGEVDYYGYANSGYNPTVIERVIQTGASSGANIPSKWTLSTSNAAGQVNQTMTFDQSAHLGVSATATPPTITAGCSGAGSSVGTGSSDLHGWITGSTAAATTCTITFGTAFTNRPACTVSGEQSAILTMTPSTTTLVVTFASTANYKFDWHCMGL